ncbi:MAG: TldD/PmbA family protein [Cyanophyceae cyanobacterium]
MIDIQTLASTAQTLAEELAIAKFDIYGSSTDSTSVKVDKGEPENVKASQRSGVTVRVWNEKGQVGITSTTDFDQTGLKTALATAKEASEFGVVEHAPDFSPAATEPIPDLKSDLVEPAPIPDLLDALVKAEKEFLDAHPAIAAVPYNNLSQSDTERFYLNSEGAMRHEARSVASTYLVSKTEQEGKKPRSAGAYRVSQGLATLDMDGCVGEAIEKTVSHLDYSTVPSGQYTIVFSAEAFLSLLGAFSNMYNAQSILDNQSLSTAESLGEAIASPLLSVYDDAHHPDNIGVSYFDGEGTPTQRVALIEKGVLTNFLHSAGTAKRMGAKPTGHAGIGAKVSVGPEFYHVTRGEQAEKSYSLDTAENVIFIDEVQALHAGVKSLEGSFSLPFDGWLVNKGSRRSVDSATVAGDFRELLKSIIYVEEETEVTPGGVCPRIWVEGLSVTGD